MEHKCATCSPSIYRQDVVVFFQNSVRLPIVSNFLGHALHLSEDVRKI